MLFFFQKKELRIRTKYIEKNKINNNYSNMNNLKIFKSNLKKPKNIVYLKKKIGDSGNIKYYPSYSKEWKDTIYSYNKNELKNIPVNSLNINKIIKSYFNLYFKDSKFLGLENRKFVSMNRRRNSLTRIYVSGTEIKHTNNKAIITLYVVNREKKNLIKKYININSILTRKVIKRYFSLYQKNILNIYNLIKKNKYFFTKDLISKKNFILYKLAYLKKFLELKNLYTKKIWSVILKKYSINHLNILRKYFLMYSLNQSKFNKFIFLPKLSNILTRIMGKNLEYNIINLKSIAYHTDIFTNALALKLKHLRFNYINSVLSILNRAYLPAVNTIKERTPIKINNNLSNKYKDGKILSYDNLENLLSNICKYKASGNRMNKNIHTTIYNSIHYKNMGGIRLEINGRLTKRYRSDRSVNFVKWKGGLKNIDSSFQRLSSVLFRGNTNSNTSYSLATDKRRIGAFAVKGWIGGK